MKAMEKYIGSSTTLFSVAATALLDAGAGGGGISVRNRA